MMRKNSTGFLISCLATALVAAVLNGGMAECSYADSYAAAADPADITMADIVEANSSFA